MQTEGKQPMGALQKRRIEATYPEKDLRVIEKAAQLLGLSVASFMRSEILRAAKAVIVNEQQFLLSNRDWDHLIDHLNNPPDPGDNLIALYKRHKSRKAKK